jgi:hypothetical protein
MNDNKISAIDRNLGQRTYFDLMDLFDHTNCRLIVIIFIIVVQHCRHLSHVATDNIKNGYLMKNTLDTSQILTKVATEKPLSTQLWQM